MRFKNFILFFSQWRVQVQGMQPPPPPTHPNVCKALYLDTIFSKYPILYFVDTIWKEIASVILKSFENVLWSEREEFRPVVVGESWVPVGFSTTVGSTLLE